MITIEHPSLSFLTESDDLSLFKSDILSITLDIVDIDKTPEIPIRWSDVLVFYSTSSSMNISKICLPHSKLTYLNASFNMSKYIQQKPKQCKFIIYFSKSFYYIQNTILSNNKYPLIKLNEKKIDNEIKTSIPVHHKLKYNMYDFRPSLIEIKFYSKKELYYQLLFMLNLCIKTDLQYFSKSNIRILIQSLSNYHEEFTGIFNEYFKLEKSKYIVDMDHVGHLYQHEILDKQHPLKYLIGYKIDIHEDPFLKKRMKWLKKNGKGMSKGTYPSSCGLCKHNDGSCVNILGKQYNICRLCMNSNLDNESIKKRYTKIREFEDKLLDSGWCKKDVLSMIKNI